MRIQLLAVLVTPTAVAYAAPPVLAPPRNALLDRCAAIEAERDGLQVRSVIAPDRNLALIVFTDRPFDLVQARQGKGGPYALLSAAFCS